MSGQPLIFLFHIPKTGGTSLREALSAAFGLNRGFIHVGPFGDRVRHEQNLKSLDEYSEDELDQVRVISGHYLSTAFEKYFPSRDIRRIVLLREPATRIHSQYNHAIRNRSKLGLKPVDFHEWYENLALAKFDWPGLYGRKLTLEDKKLAIASVGDNYMSKFLLDASGSADYQDFSDSLLLSETNRFLDTFHHVGAIENLHDCIEVLQDLMDVHLDVGTYNKTGRFFFSRLRRHRTMNDALRRYLTERNAVDYAVYKSWCC